VHLGRTISVVEDCFVTEFENKPGDEVGLSGPKYFPAVDRAYDFVIPSYQLLINRFEAADNRLTALLTLASTLTLAVPIFAKNVQPNISFNSPLFIVGMLIFLVIAIVGIWGRSVGSIALPDPMVLYNENLTDSEWEFKKNLIFFAGEGFNSNTQAIRRKGNLSAFLSAALLVEIIVFVAWITNLHFSRTWLWSHVSH
jgi:hypothetical protein